MARPREALVAVQLKSLPVGLHADGGGLYLRVTQNPELESEAWRSWVFRYTLFGKAHEMGLGPFPDVGLANARRAALAQRELKRSGVDPLAERRRVRAAAALEAARSIPFRKVVEEYIETHKAKWRNTKTAAQWRASLEAYAYPLMGNVGVQEIDADLIQRVLEPIWEKKPETARRVRSRLENMLDYATARKLRTGDNPARWRGGPLKNLLANTQRKVVNHPALPYDRAGTFMAELKGRPGTSARALEFLILTAARTNEAIGARWAEIDTDKAVWTIPAERMKGGRSHRVPLSKSALAVLKEQKPAAKGEFVFPLAGTDERMSGNAILALLKRMDRSDITAHGFRSTFRDWAAEQTSFPRELAERSLAHALKDKSEAAYQRNDLLEKRRPLMTAWANFCGKPSVKQESPSPEAAA
jgi:integrase